MKSFYSTLAFGLGASAAALKRQAATCDCNFNIQVNGFQSGLLGSLPDGQIRVGPGYSSPINFCFNEAAGTISDNLGRGCLVAGAPMQYQCDNVNVPASAGITIDNSGVISHNGSSVWYECLVNDLGDYNVYTEDNGLATKCQKVQLTTAGNKSCGAPNVPTVSVVGPTMFSTIPASTVTAPAQVSTVTAPAQVSTVTAPAASCPAAGTITLPAPAAETVTLPAPVASTITLPAPAAITVTQFQASGASVITVTETSTSVETTTVSAPAVTITSVATAPAQTVYVTSIHLSTQVAVSSVPVTIVQSTTATETKAIPTTAVSVQTSVATSIATSVQTQTAPGTTLVQTSVQTAPTTVVVSATPSSTAAPTTSSVVAPVSSSSSVAPTTSSVVAPVSSSSSVVPTTSSSTRVITSTISSTISSTSSAPTACGTPINGQYACPEQCPLDLTNTAFEYPHNLAVNGVNGYFGEVSANSTTSFTFDIPASLAGKTCNTYFALPVKSQLVTADYTLSGFGSVSFSSEGKQVASFSPAAGNKYLVASGPCAAGQAVSYEAKATVGESLRWFQDWNACALGLFVVPQ